MRSRAAVNELANVYKLSYRQVHKKERYVIKYMKIMRAGTKKISRAAKAESRGQSIRRIRDILKRTQEQLGNALNLSVKAIQSYEQGWRAVPVRVMIQLLVLLALHKKQAKKTSPCWEIRNCPENKRKQCPSYTIGKGQFCWFLAPQTCHPKGSKSSQKILPCMECPVVQRLLKA